MAYAKPWLSYEAQLNQLIARGMVVTDRTRALDYLERIGYYRLSGYWFVFRERSEPCCLLNAGSFAQARKIRVDRMVLDQFKPGTCFQHAVDLYVFDKKLRLLALDALERIEIALRVDIAHRLGQQDRFAYLNPNLFFPGFSKTLNKQSGLTRHHEWLAKHAGLISRSKEPVSGFAGRIPRSVRPEPGCHGNADRRLPVGMVAKYRRAMKNPPAILSPK